MYGVVYEPGCYSKVVYQSRQPMEEESSNRMRFAVLLLLLLLPLTNVHRRPAKILRKMNLLRRNDLVDHGGQDFLQNRLQHLLVMHAEDIIVPEGLRERWNLFVMIDEALDKAQIRYDGEQRVYTFTNGDSTRFAFDY